VSQYTVFLPEAILVATALGSAVLGFAWRKRPDLLWAFALVGISLATFITLDMMGLGVGSALGVSPWPAPVGTQGDFTAELKMNVDRFALFFQVMFEFVALLAILASRGFISSHACGDRRSRIGTSRVLVRVCQCSTVRPVFSTSG